jgi:hypothetical protein
MGELGLAWGQHNRPCTHATHCSRTGHATHRDAQPPTPPPGSPKPSPERATHKQFFSLSLSLCSYTLIHHDHHCQLSLHCSRNIVPHQLFVSLETAGGIRCFEQYSQKPFRIICRYRVSANLLLFIKEKAVVETRQQREAKNMLTWMQKFSKQQQNRARANLKCSHKQQCNLINCCQWLAQCALNGQHQFGKWTVCFLQLLLLRAFQLLCALQLLLLLQAQRSYELLLWHSCL